MAVEMDIFERIASASATAGGNWIKDGVYVFAIKEVKYEELFNGLTWVTELIVLAAEPIPGMMEVGGQPCDAGVQGAVQVIPSAVGSKVSFTRPLRIKNAAGDIKMFMLALTNKREEDFDREEAEAKQKRVIEEAQGVPLDKRTQSPFAEACQLIKGPQQIVRGAVIKCTTYRKKNQGRDNPANKGKILTLQDWGHIPHVKADIAERRRLIDAGLPIPWPPPAQPAAGTPPV
jgi:hypothetical protein